MLTHRIGLCLLLTLGYVVAPSATWAQEYCVDGIVVGLPNGELCPGRITNPAAYQWDQKALYVPTTDEYLIATTEWTFSSGGVVGMRMTPDGTLLPLVSPHYVTAGNGGVTSVDMAYNSNADDILLVMRDADPSRIRGLYLGSDGLPIGSPFLISSFGGEAHVAFSPDSNRYLVTFAQRILGVWKVFCVLIDGDSTNPSPVLTSGLVESNALSDVLAYNSTTKRFFVAFTKDLPPPRRADIYGARITTNGVVEAVFPIETTNNNQQIPQLAYSDSTNTFLLAYENWETGEANATGAILNGGGGIIRRFSVAATSGWDVPGPIGYNATTKTFVATWRTAFSDTRFDHRVREFDPSDGTPINPAVLISSKDIGLLSVETRPDRSDPQALILWNSSFGLDGVHAGILHLPPVITTRVVIGSPVEGAATLSPFDIHGWAADPEAPTGTGVDAANVWAYPAGGGDPVFLGNAEYGLDRPDVGTFLGDPRFDPSGFRLLGASLPDGDYKIRVFARSTLSGEFDGVAVRSLIVGPDPRMSIAAPASGAMVSWPFTVSGWAIDRAAPTGTGVDAVHVWAFPDGSGNDFVKATFLGSATLGVTRPGVAGLYGAQFEPSGFQLNSNKPLAPGVYTFKIFAHSTITGTFNNVREVPVTVKAVTRMSIGSPANGSVVGTPFTVSGWAFNTGSPGGVGVDTIHVWAIPASGGSGFFLGVPTLGISRPDVATFFGVPEFEPSGFQLEVTTPLPLGAYTIRVYVRNTVTNSFDKFQDRAVTVATDPRMAIGIPAVGASVTAPFTVSGWAVDLAASNGTGIDAVHVWAYPTNGGPGTFLGVATYGISRPDVATFLGDPQLEPSGFELEVTTPLASRSYTLRVFARSTVTGTFNNSSSRSITVP